jgi:four helix bundle protein
MAKKVQRFEDLIAWQKSMDLAVEVFSLTSAGRIARKFAFCDQLQRAASSVPANIAEGFERGTRAEFHRFLSISKASCAELRTRLHLALRVGYLDQAVVDETLARAEDVSRIVGRLRKTVATQRDTPRS